MRKLLAAAALAAVSSVSMAAAPGVTCSAGVNSCAAAFDQVDPPEGTHWQTQSAWWSGLQESVTISLGGTYTVYELGLTVDNNDSYLVERSLDGGSWVALGSVAASEGNVPVVPGGLDYFDGFQDPDNTEYAPGLDFAPVNAAYLRVSATGGDSAYSVGEVTVWMNPVPVPEPATWAMMALGVAALLARRRAPQR